ncbi:MAG: hypothetical protein H0X17_02155 [Deltaproteobacteria bacterium]|nr:hypothetical protein [Deltaproteobacteria bacterium]
MLHRLPCRRTALLAVVLAVSACIDPDPGASTDDAYEVTDSELVGAVDVGWAPLYKQDDPAWAQNPYVFNHDWWLGYVGCTLTAMSMGAGWVTYQRWSPAWTNASTANYFETLHTLVPYIRHLGTGLRWLDERHGSAPGIVRGSEEHRALVRAILAALRRGNAVIVGITYTSPVGPARWTRHTMLATGIDREGWILVHDPATGTRHRLGDYTSMRQFGGYDLAEEIAYYP